MTLIVLMRQIEPENTEQPEILWDMMLSEIIRASADMKLKF